MKSPKLRQFVFVLATLLMIASTANAYPKDPDNAALLYYQAFLSFPKDHQISLDAVVDGTSEPNEAVRAYITKCQTSIKLTLAASELEKCDWGMRYSEGFDAIMAHLGQMRSLGRVMAAQGQILIHDGQVREGLKRFLVMRKMAHHTGNNLIISYLVRVSVKSMGDKCLRQILSHRPLDQETLTWLKQQLVTGPDLPGNIKKALKIEEEIAVGQMSVQKDRLVAMIIKDNQDISAHDLQRLKSVGEPFYAANRVYYQATMQEMYRILDGPLSYEKKYQGVVNIIQTVATDSQKKDEAILTALLIPAMQRLVTGQTKANTEENVLRIGLELFIIKARTGAFPAQLPSGAPLDQFSGKAFKNNKSKKGFTLTCQAEDLDKKTKHQYAFTVQ
jgi:hypothetical protein